MKGEGERKKTSMPPQLTPELEEIKGKNPRERKYGPVRAFFPILIFHLLPTRKRGIERESEGGGGKEFDDHS